MDFQMIAQIEAKNKIKKLRYSGIIAASFILVQCVIWIILCIVGICYFYINGKIDSVTFDAFKYVYLNLKGEKQIPTVISPIIFNLVCWLYLIGCNIWLFISIKLIQALYDWKNYLLIRKYLKIWIFFTFFVCAIDLLFSALFLVDFKLIEQRNNNINNDEALYEFQASDTFDVSSVENLKEIKEIGHLERDIRNELKEYLLLKAHVKNHFMHGFLTIDANNDTFHNPFHKAVQRIKREIMYTSGRYNQVIIALKRMKSRNERNLEIPSAILMTIFLRGVIIWVVNLFMASYMSYFYFC